MIITLSGNIASGKSTIGEALAKKLGFKHYSTGNFMRQIAKERNISLQELNNLAERSDEIDRANDEMTLKLSKTQDNFIIDSRLGWHFIPNSIKIFLHAGRKTQVERLMKDMKDNKRKEEQFKDEKEALQRIKEREDSEKKRYMKYYGLDYNEKKHYDLWYSTDNKTIEQCADEIIEFLKTKKVLKTKNVYMPKS